MVNCRANGANNGRLWYKEAELGRKGDGIVPRNPQGAGHEEVLGWEESEEQQTL